MKDLQHFKAECTCTLGTAHLQLTAIGNGDFKGILDMLTFSEC